MLTVTVNIFQFISLILSSISFGFSIATLIWAFSTDVTRNSARKRRKKSKRAKDDGGEGHTL